jgi:hypothetical protein
MSTCVRRMLLMLLMDGWRKSDDNDQMCAERRTAHSLKRRDNAWARWSRLHRKAFTWVAQDTRVCSKHTEHTRARMHLGKQSTKSGIFSLRDHPPTAHTLLKWQLMGNIVLTYVHWRAQCS